MEVFKDEDVNVDFVSEASLGNIRVKPAKKVSSIEELTDDAFEKLFSVSNISAAILFELLKAQGTNIILNELGDDGIAIDIVDRKQEDGLNFLWTPAPPKEDLGAVSSRLSSAIVVDTSSGSKKPTMIEDQKIESMKEDSSESNYLLKQLDRIP